METPNYTNLQAAEKLREISIKGTASDADTLIPLQKTDSAEHKIPSKEQLKRVNFPALPYAPGPFMLSEVKNVQRTVANEMIDFLDSVRDLLKLLLIVKTKHLKSPVPIPGDVLREIHYIGDKRGDTRMRNFERKIFGKSDIVPIFTPRQSIGSFNESVAGSSTGVATGLASARNDGSSIQKGSTVNESTESGVKSVQIQSDNSKEKSDISKEKSVQNPSDTSKEQSKAVHLPAWLVGKKPKPIWQTIDSSMDEQIINERIIANHRKKLKEKVSGEKDYVDLLKKPHNLQDPNYRRIANALLPQIKCSDSSFRKQMDMLKAFAGGFESVEEYRKYLDHTRQHWFKELLIDSLELGLVVTKDVILGYERLGHYYDVDFSQVEQSRAKMCLIVQSLPIWDISRATVQRGLDFVLRNVLKLPSTDIDISKWLNVRKLVRLTFPPEESVDTADIIFSDEDISPRTLDRRRDALAFSEIHHGQVRTKRLYRR